MIIFKAVGIDRSGRGGGHPHASKCKNSESAACSDSPGFFSLRVCRDIIRDIGDAEGYEDQMRQVQHLLFY